MQTPITLIIDTTTALPANFTQVQLDLLIHQYKLACVLSQYKFTYVLNDINSGLALHQYKMKPILKVLPGIVNEMSLALAAHQDKMNFLLQEIPYGEARAFGSFWRVRHWWVPFGYQIQAAHQHFRYSNEYLANLSQERSYRPTYFEPYQYHPSQVVPSGSWDSLLEMKKAITKTELIPLDQQMDQNAAAIVDYLEL